MNLLHKRHNHGWWISLTVANKEQSSWWSSPPDSIDHIGIEYLKNRYSMIRTENRACVFKHKYKELMKVIREEEEL